MLGRLHRIDSKDGKARIEYFRSGKVESSPRAFVIYIHGIEGGFNEQGYFVDLSSTLAELDCALIQVRLRSSGLCYGFHTLADDVTDLELLVQTLPLSAKVFLLGYSTGCQDSVSFLKNSSLASIVHGLILHGPVSDRLANNFLNSNSKKLIELALLMVSEGKKSELMPKGALWGHPITAERYLSMATLEGEDEMFAPDLDVATLSARLGHIKVPTLIVLCGKDQFVPPEFSDHAKTAAKLQEAIQCSPQHFVKKAVLANADHGISDEQDQAEFVKLVSEFVKQYI